MKETKRRGPSRRDSAEADYLLKISLQDIQPEIWRRVRLSSSIPLETLHLVLQVVMGWADSHLHQFLIGKHRYGIPDPEFDDDTINERGVLLGSLLKAPGDSMIYEYDFGDGWVHHLLLEQSQQRLDKQEIAQCIEGERNCPPEDVGGPWGYDEFLQAFLQESHPEHQRWVTWIGNDHDPEYFDCEEVNANLKKIRF